jgi:hypothetical protein
MLDFFRGFIIIILFALRVNIITAVLASLIGFLAVAQNSRHGPLQRKVKPHLDEFFKNEG